MKGGQNIAYDYSAFDSCQVFSTRLEPFFDMPSSAKLKNNNFVNFERNEQIVARSQVTSICEQWQVMFTSITRHTPRTPGRNGTVSLLTQCSTTSKRSHFISDSTLSAQNVSKLSACRRLFLTSWVSCDLRKDHFGRTPAHQISIPSVFSINLWMWQYS